MSVRKDYHSIYDFYRSADNYDEWQYMDFLDPDEDFMDANVQYYIEKLDAQRLKSIHEEYGYGYRRGNNALCGYLAEIFSIKDLRIIYRERAMAGSSDVVGSYDHSNNTVVFYHDKGEDQNRKAVWGDIKTVAHEMWHAHQYKIIDDAKPHPGRNIDDVEFGQAFIYSKNFGSYIQCQESLKGYNDQLVEIEARKFSDKFAIVMKDTSDSSANKSYKHRFGAKALLGFLRGQ